MMVEALIQTIAYIRRIRDMSPDRLPKWALKSSQSIATHGGCLSWYAAVLHWFSEHGLDIDRLPPLHYDEDSPYFSLSLEERNRVLRQDLIQMHNRETWSGPLPTKMQFYGDHFLRFTEYGFIKRPSYMDVHMSHAMRVAIGQIKVSSLSRD